MAEPEFLQKVTRIETAGGAVTRFVRSDDPDFRGFGEVYFSFIESGSVKAWRRHHSASIFLTVPHGHVRFVLLDGENVHAFALCADRPERLRVPPSIWFGFSGLADHTSVVCSFSDLPHDSSEVERISADDFPFDWSR